MTIMEQNTFVGNASKTHKETYSEIMRKIKNSPFVSVEHEGKYFVAVGKFRITQAIFNSHEDAAKAYETPTYDTIMQLMFVLNANEEIKSSTKTI